MKIYRFDAEIAHPIEQFGSRGVSMGRGVRFNGDVQVGCLHVKPGGVIGYHEATRPQLFMCVAGEGWVRGESETRTPIRPGQAAFWTSGEHHESGSEAGMMAIVVEGENLDPSQYMPKLAG